MQVKTVHNARPITDPSLEWEDMSAIVNLYRWTLYVLRNDAYAGYTDCLPFP